MQEKLREQVLLFEKELDPFKRQSLLLAMQAEFGDSLEEKALLNFMQKIWEKRFGKRKPKRDEFVMALMEMRYLKENSNHDFGGKKRKQAAQILNLFELPHLEQMPEDEREVLTLELKNTFMRYIDVSAGGRGFTSIIFGMGQMSDDSVAKKIADQISTIAFDLPYQLKMQKEFKVLQDAAVDAFRERYPEREQYLRKLN